MKMQERLQELLKNIDSESLKEICGNFFFKVSDGESTLLKIDQTSLSFEKISVQNDLKEKAKLTIEASQQTWEDIFKQKINTQMAFMLGKVKLHGDTSLALKLAQIMKIA